jgi:hypothetical protein
MTAEYSLDDAWTKVKWAEQNFAVLRKEIEALEQRDAHRVTVETSTNAGEYVFRVHDLPELPPDWGMRIGDYLHSARCALDYLMVNLVALATNGRPEGIEGTQFPIYQDQKRFNGAIGELKKNQLLSGWLSRVEELQPYNAGNPSIWGWSSSELTVPPLPYALDRLSLLDNIDKHRCILRPWWGTRLQGVSLQAPPEFQPIGMSLPGDALREGSEIGSATYKAPVPFVWKPDEMDVKRKLSLQISFNEPSPSKSVVEILGLCLWGVEMTLTIFEPVFTHQKPPLLVTASMPSAETQTHP